MKHRSTADVVRDLQTGGRLIVCDEVVDPYLEIAEIQRRVYSSGGPAILFPHVRGCSVPCVSNLFANLDQARYLFRHTLDAVRRIIELKIDPQALVRKPFRYAKTPLTALHMLPRAVRSGPVLERSGTIADLPQIQSWPMDGGPFITLPQVLSVDPQQPRRLMGVNLGMYRVQLGGNQYVKDREIGLHYQIHRGIGVHHQKALERGEKLPVTITVGGSPAMTLAAVMPLPEGLTELTFAGALAGRRIPMVVGPSDAPIYADADVAICGWITPGEKKSEGPFGDHLGYYSLAHDFPLLQVKSVFMRKNCIWPFTVVGRPPQEDTTFGQLIHELTDPIIPSVIPGVRAVHAVDAAGVHPLLLAIGSERYMPFLKQQEPAEILTQSHAILGNGQLSLAKYLLIIDGNQVPQLDIHRIDDFFHQVLQRVHWKRDLHFHTRTTIDTLDYSGDGFNRGSKLVIAAAGEPIRELSSEFPSDFILPEGFCNPRIVLPGILAVEPTRETKASSAGPSPQGRFAAAADPNSFAGFPLVTIVDESDFASRTVKNWLWVTFTRSNPAKDVDGRGGTAVDRHWGCDNPLVINALTKAHHAPPVVEDPAVVAKVDALASRRGPLARWL